MSSPTLVVWIDELLREFDAALLKPGQLESNLSPTWSEDAATVIAEISPSEAKNESEHFQVEDVGAQLKRLRRLLMHRHSMEIIPGMINDAITSSPWFKLQFAILIFVFFFATVGVLVVGNSVINVQEKSQQAALEIQNNSEEIGEQTKNFLESSKESTKELQSAISKAKDAESELVSVQDTVRQVTIDQAALKDSLGERQQEVRVLQEDVSQMVLDELRPQWKTFVTAGGMDTAHKKLREDWGNTITALKIELVDSRRYELNTLNEQSKNPIRISHGHDQCVIEGVTSDGSTSDCRLTKDEDEWILMSEDAACYVSCYNLKLAFEPG